MLVDGGMPLSILYTQGAAGHLVYIYPAKYITVDLVAYSHGHGVALAYASRAYSSRHSSSTRCSVDGDGLGGRLEGAPLLSPPKEK